MTGSIAADAQQRCHRCARSSFWPLWSLIIPSKTIMWVNCFRGPVSLLHIGTIGKCTNELLYAPMYVICITYLCTEGLKVDFLYSVDILFDVKETIFIMIWSLFSLSLTGQTKEQSQLIQRGFLGLTWKDAAIAILLITIIISCSTMALWAIKGRKRSSTEKFDFDPDFVS